MAGEEIDIKKARLTLRVWPDNDAHSQLTIAQVGMLGVGSMGSMLSLLLSELEIEVFYYDPSK